MLKKMGIVLSSLSLMTVAAVPAFAKDPESCKVVKMSDPGWTDIAATNAIADILLTGLGYQQQLSNLSVPIGLIGLEKGQVDIFLGNWMPAQKEQVESRIKSGNIEVLATNLANAKYTLAVPSYVSAAGVKSFEDLAKHGEKFGYKIYGISAGSPANDIIKKMIKTNAFGLGKWQLVESGEQSMLAEVARKTNSKGWIVFLGWEPHVMNTRFQLTYLDKGDAYFGPNFGSALVNTLSRKGFATNCPNVGRLFKQLKFTVPFENNIISNVIEKKTNVRAAAMAALKENPKFLDAWLAGVTTRDGSKDGVSAVKKYIGL